MTLELLLEEIGEDYGLRVNGVRFGTPSRVEWRQPEYPRNTLLRGVQADVTLALRVDAEGKVLEVHPYQTSLNIDGCESKLRYDRQDFERASLKAARSWRIVPSEFIDARPAGGTYMQTINFVIGNPGDPDRWRRLYAGPVVPIPWEVPSAPPDAVAGPKEGEALAASSRFKLKDDVVGSLL